MSASNPAAANIAAVESGGTKFRAAIYSGEIAAAAEAPAPLAELRIDTTTPDETLHAIGDFLAEHEAATLGIASFGPLIVDRSSENYGSVAPTPKPGWTGAPILSVLRDRLGVTADIQTDVEAAAVAEQQFGAGRGHDGVAYVLSLIHI